MFKSLKIITKQKKQIKYLQEIIDEFSKESFAINRENCKLKGKITKLKQDKDIIEYRTVELARIIKSVSDEIDQNQYNSMENFRNKIKSMLNAVKQS